MSKLSNRKVEKRQVTTLQQQFTTEHAPNMPSFHSKHTRFSERLRDCPRRRKLDFLVAFYIHRCVLPGRFGLHASVLIKKLRLKSGANTWWRKDVHIASDVCRNHSSSVRGVLDLFVMIAMRTALC